MKILFVCTGNVFRSMIAEQSLKKLLNDLRIKGVTVGSAGLRGGEFNVMPEVHEACNSLRLNSYEHQPRKLDYELASEYDTIISMAKNHKDYLKDLGLESRLFNEVCCGEETDVLDVPDVVPDWVNEPDKLYEFINETARYINDSMHYLTRELGITY